MEWWEKYNTVANNLKVSKGDRIEQRKFMKRQVKYEKGLEESFAKLKNMQNKMERKFETEEANNEKATRLIKELKYTSRRMKKIHKIEINAMKSKIAIGIQTTSLKHTRDLDEKGAQIEANNFGVCCIDQ